MPVQFLSDEWTEELEQRLNASEAFRKAAVGSNVTIQNVINAPDGAKRYWMRFDGGRGTGSRRRRRPRRRSNRTTTRRSPWPRASSTR